MNPEQQLQEIEKAIAKIDSSNTKRWAIVWFDNTFKAVPVQEANKYGTIFITFGGLALQKGFSNTEWERLLYKIATFLKQKGLL